MPYFDHNATTPMSATARRAWLEAEAGHWHNPSSLYREAAAARRELERCRERLAELIGEDDPERIVFTSGATEANNGFFRACAGRHQGGEPVRAVISAYEHPSVRDPAFRWCRVVEATIGEMESILGAGEVDVISWMAANNETGVLGDWRIGDAGSAAPGAWRHCDAAQWFGRIPASEMKAAGATVVGSAHKFGGPKGTGFVRLGEPPECLAWQWGGPQEIGVRAGTENLPAVAAMVAALEEAETRLPGDPAGRDAFESTLGWKVVGGDQPRLWNTSMVVAPRHDNRLWVARLSQRGIQCSTGSACSSGSEGASHVLAAMGLPAGEMKRVLRFSSGLDTPPADWIALAAALAEVLTELDVRGAKSGSAP